MHSTEIGVDAKWSRATCALPLNYGIAGDLRSEAIGSKTALTMPRLQLDQINLARDNHLRSEDLKYDVLG